MESKKKNKQTHRKKTRLVVTRGGRWGEGELEKDEREKSLPEKENKNVLAKEKKQTKHTIHTQSIIMG